MEQMTELILEFIRNPRPNHKWLFIENKVSIYVRSSLRFIEKEKMVRVLDLANFQVEPEFQRTGIVTRLLSELEEYVQVPMYVENVLNKNFETFMRGRKEWKEVGDPINPSFLWLPSETSNGPVK